MKKTMQFFDLNKDIIIAVLSNCDIHTILRVEQVCVPPSYASCLLTPQSLKTCKDLRDLASSRYVWLTLVQNLDHDHAPDLLPQETLRSLSVERLREMAIRSTRGRLNWTSPKGPKATRSTVLELNEAHDNDFTQGMLVPGGKYFVFQAKDGSFHCYNTETAVNVCSHRLPSDGERVKSIDCLSDSDGATLILAYLADQTGGRL